MKKSIFLAAVICGAVMLTLFNSPGVRADGGCYYKRKHCWFTNDTKCTGDGNECGLADGCGGGNYE
jgi:hypothetical protein